jgi:hypothetical protein
MAIEPPEPTHTEHALRLCNAKRMRYRAMAQQAVAVEGDRSTRERDRRPIQSCRFTGSRDCGRTRHVTPPREPEAPVSGDWQS